MKTYSRILQRLSKHFPITCPVVYIMAGGTLDVTVKEREFGYKSKGVHAVAVITTVTVEIDLVFPLDAYRVVIGKVGFQSCRP